MAAVHERRGFQTTEAMEYLGVKRRFFDEHIAPRCKPTPAGTSMIYERAELDAAWEQYKIDAGSERPTAKGGKEWDARQPVSTKQKPDMKLISSTKVSAFDSVASAILKKPKAG